jgi:hypothetical protein
MAAGAAAMTATGYWGEPTATIDWCEPNYEYSFYVAEFWNTVSNLLFVLLGLYGLARSVKEGFEWRFHAQFIAVMITGLGSAMFHGTLQLVYVTYFSSQNLSKAAQGLNGMASKRLLFVNSATSSAMRRPWSGP